MKELAEIYSNGSSYRKNSLKVDTPKAPRYDPLIDGKKAMEWYQKAADLGDKDAMWHLGGIYYIGRFTTQNYREAMR